MLQKKLFKKKTLWPLLMDGVQLSQSYRPLWGDSLLFPTKSPGVPGTHFISLRRMKDWADLGTAQWFWAQDPWIGNAESEPLGHCFNSRSKVLGSNLNYIFGQAFGSNLTPRMSASFAVINIKLARTWNFQNSFYELFLILSICVYEFLNFMNSIKPSNFAKTEIYAKLDLN